MKEVFQFHNRRLNLSIYKAWKGIVKFEDNGEGGNFHMFLWKHSPETQGLWKWILTIVLLFRKDLLLPQTLQFRCLRGLALLSDLRFSQPLFDYLQKTPGNQLLILVLAARFIALQDEFIVPGKAGLQLVCQKFLFLL